MTTPRHGAERGAAALWVLACGAVVLAVAAALTVRSLAVLARHRAEAAADLAALSAAARIGIGGDPCAAAERIAAANGAQLVRCAPALDAGGRSGSVRVVVRVRARLPVVGTRTVLARARAARLPGAAAPAESRPDRSASAGWHAVWHADAVRNLSKTWGCRSPPRTKDITRVELTVTEHSGGAIPVVAVSGEVDVYAAPALREGLTDLLQSGKSVVVDLSDVAFLDSTGLGALVAARTTAAEHGASLPLVCTHQRILKLFTITGLDGVFQIHDTVDDAVAGLAGTAG